MTIFINGWNDPPQDPNQGDTWTPSDYPMIILRWDGYVWATPVFSRNSNDTSLAYVSNGELIIAEGFPSSTIKMSIGKSGISWPLISGISIQPTLVNPSTGQGLQAEEGSLAISPSGIFVKNGLSDTAWGVLDAGSGANPGSSVERQTVSISSTVTMANVASYAQLLAPMAKSYALTRVETNVPAKVRIYNNHVQRQADTYREPNDPIPLNHGIVLDLTTTPGNLIVDIAPAVIGSCSDDPATNDIPVTLENKHTQSSVVNVSLTYLPLET